MAEKPEKSRFFAVHGDTARYALERIFSNSGSSVHSGRAGLECVIESVGGAFIRQCAHWQIPLFFRVSRKRKNANKHRLAHRI